MILSPVFIGEGKKLINKNSLHIRPFNLTDRDTVRKISCDTAFPGENPQIFVDDVEILADFLTSYFTDYEPESCFVAVDKESVVGYIIGSLDTKRMKRVFISRILPGIVLKSFLRGVIFKRRIIRLAANLISSLFKGDFSFPDFHSEYPATLHINIARNYRGGGLGTELIERYLSYLRAKNIRGVHFGTMSESAKDFFIKQGFKLLLKKKRSILKYHFGRKMTYYVFGKRFVK